MKEVKILLAGIGGYGINYWKELTEKNIPEAKIEGVCEVMPDVRTRFPGLNERQIPVYQTLEEFYAEHDADLAVISTPIHLHYQQILTCLGKGSNVLAEKPVCTSAEGAQRIIEAEAASGRFAAVGYQLNYQRDVLALKKDILEGRFGKPILMKALHAMSRGRSYYQRNHWAGRKTVNGCTVNDSPFNNACAHQFQNMTFLLGQALDQAASLLHTEGELYRANNQVENFDTAAVYAVAEGAVPIYYYTTHNLKTPKLGPIAEYRFEKGTIYYGKDYGQGPVMEYVAEMKDGSCFSYADIAKGERLQKLYDAIQCARGGDDPIVEYPVGRHSTMAHPVCTVSCAVPHLQAVEALANLPVYPVRDEYLNHVQEAGDEFCRITNLEEVFTLCYQNQIMPSQAEAGWK